MKKSLFLSIVLGCSLLCYPVFSQNSQSYTQLGMPGDNLNLYGVLDIFQQSQTLEEFEQKLNAEDSKINNLDLNGDGRTDYIKVIDNVNGSAHAIVLRDYINQNESQDVAVIEVEKDKNNQIMIQIIGDMALYGKDYIVEPAYGTPNPGYTGNTNVSSNGGHNVYEYNNYYTNSNVGYGSNYVYTIGAWSIIHYIFAPSYVVYNSPYRWGYYPSYYRAWRPMFYDDYYGHWYNHHSYGYYRQTHDYHVSNAHTYYTPRRTTSVVVHNRMEKGEYKPSYTRGHTNVEKKVDRHVRPQNNNRNTNNQVKEEKRVSHGTNTPNRPTSTNNSNRPTSTPIAKPTPRQETRNNANQNVNTNQNQNARSAEKQNNRPATTTTPNNNRNVNNSERQTQRQETRPATRTETKQAPTSRPAEKKVEHKESERK